MRNNFVLFFCLLLFWSCQKEPGVGGNGSITGRVMTEFYPPVDMDPPVKPFPSQDQYVYIVFGNHVGYDKRVKTDYNGAFRFSYLYPGKYVIYTYSEDTTGASFSGRMVIKKDIQLSKNQHYEMPDIIIYE